MIDENCFFFKLAALKKRFLKVKIPKLPQRDRKEETKSFMLLSFDKKKKKSIKSSKVTDFKVFLLNLSEWPVDKNYKWENLYK